MDSNQTFYRKVYKKYSNQRRPQEVEDIENLDNIESIDFSNYFEDGDVTGVRMKYRFQFILTRNNDIPHIFSNFDLYPSRVAWDGKTTWFTSKSEQAYKYMCNIVNENCYSPLYEHRLLKYFTYGFSIVLPELNIKTIENKHSLKISDNFMFNINYVNKNQILVEHNSHIADKLSSIEFSNKKAATNTYQIALLRKSRSSSAFMKFIQSKAALRFLQSRGFETK